MALFLFWIVGCSWVRPEVSWTAVWQILGFLCQKQGSQLSRELPQRCLFFKKNLIVLFVYGCAGSLLLCGFYSSCGARLPVAVAPLVAEHSLYRV